MLEDNDHHPSTFFSKIEQRLGTELTIVSTHTRGTLLPSKLTTSEIEALATELEVEIKMISAVRGSVLMSTIPEIDPQPASPSAKTQAATSSTFASRSVQVVLAAEPSREDVSEVYSYIHSEATSITEAAGCIIPPGLTLLISPETNIVLNIRGIVEHCSSSEQRQIITDLKEIPFVTRVFVNAITTANLNFGNKFMFASPLGSANVTALSTSKRGKGVQITITDSGIAHPEWIENFGRTYRACEIIPDIACPESPYNMFHGTHIAGIIGLQQSWIGMYGGDNTGFEGMASGATVHSMIADEQGTGYTSVYNALRSWAGMVVPNSSPPRLLVEDDVMIYSVSIGEDPAERYHPFGAIIPYSWSYHQSLDQLDDFMHTYDLALAVVATGNTGHVSLGTICDPARAANALSVGATVNRTGVLASCQNLSGDAVETHTRAAYCSSSSSGGQTNEQRASSTFHSPFFFSSSGPTIDGRYRPQLSAPGGPIVSMGTGDTGTGSSGTSMAAPYVVASIASALSDYSSYPSVKPRGATLTAVAIAGSYSYYEDVNYLAHFYNPPDGQRTMYASKMQSYKYDAWNVMRGYGLADYTAMREILERKTWYEGEFQNENGIESISLGESAPWFTFNESNSGLPSDGRLAKFKVKLSQSGGAPDHMKIVLAYMDTSANVGRQNTALWAEVDKSEDSIEDDTFQPVSPVTRVIELDLIVVLNFGTRQTVRMPAPYAKAINSPSEELYKRELTENNQVVWIKKMAGEQWPSEVLVYVAARRLVGETVKYSVAVNSEFDLEKQELDGADLAPGKQCFGTWVGSKCDCGKNSEAANFEDCSLQTKTNPISFKLAPFEKAYFSISNNKSLKLKEKGSKRVSTHYPIDLPIMPFAQSKLRRFMVAVGTEAGVVPDIRSSFIQGLGEYSFYSWDAPTSVHLVEFTDQNPQGQEVHTYPTGQDAYSELVAEELTVVAHCGDSSGKCIAVVANWDAYHTMTLSVSGVEVKYLGNDVNDTLWDRVMEFVMSPIGMASCVGVIAVIVMLCMCICSGKDDMPPPGLPIGMPPPGPPMSMGMPMGPPMSMGMPPGPPMSMGIGGMPPPMSMGYRGGPPMSMGYRGGPHMDPYSMGGW